MPADAAVQAEAAAACVCVVKEPAAQSVGALEPCGQKAPRGHTPSAGVAVEEPLPLKKPAAVGPLGVVSPAWPQNWPAGHAMQSLTSPLPAAGK